VRLGAVNLPPPDGCCNVHADREQKSGRITEFQRQVQEILSEEPRHGEQLPSAQAQDPLHKQLQQQRQHLQRREQAPHQARGLGHASGGESQSARPGVSQCEPLRVFVSQGCAGGVRCLP